MDSIDAALSGVGERLRAVRRGRHRTLADVADATGISVSTLSRLESGQRKPTLELLLPLSSEYAIPLDELVGAPATGDPRVHVRPIRRDGRIILPLSRGATGVMAYKQIIQGRDVPATPQPRAHPGYEWLYVLSGRLRLVLGDRDMILEPGEPAEFDTRTPHWFSAADREPVEILALFDAEGQRVHVSVPGDTIVGTG
ncbi:helix-turn-helix transcriptional regulator [Aeromicrobium sp. YIM 150415]|uniref:Helix-turn-helix domain-containing protein n=1 Tax=Aeromicrobium piscarium TaxID=2590901 RepID=A0A554S822_9ACTN|nr:MULTISPECIES: XRE family transcriptional regulator [Aeromicrobium]MBM9464718.1 helix-turn-helix transcriptional regulator [Aeromicrobium sp. YIM 150415]TSD62465.1 helix-turn-helix domain-containing protein [Aeromicrobium piscarium]